MKDLELQMDLSEDVSQSNTVTDEQTEARSQMTKGIIEEVTLDGTSQQRSAMNSEGAGGGIGTIPSPQASTAPATYNDFLGRQQTQVRNEAAVIHATKLHQVAAQATMEESEISRFNNDDSSMPSQSVSQNRSRHIVEDDQE